MTKSELKRINALKEACIIAIENFDKAAQDWGWQSDQGSGSRVEETKVKYEEDKKVLLSLINSF